MNEIIRRKVARAATIGTENGAAGAPGADQGWRLGFARAARDCTGLLIEVASMKVHKRSLAEVLELPPDRAFMALLDGPDGGLGLIILSAEVMSALIEMQTTGRVSSTAPLPRKPTRTDAAMVATTIDRALVELDAALAEEADLIWAGGFRYASFLEDPRPLGLLLEDQPYRVMTAELALAEGARRGGMILALPADGRGRKPALPRSGEVPDPAASAPSFSIMLAEAVMGAGCVLQAAIGRLSMPLQQVMALEVGQVMALPDATLERITLEAPDGHRLAQARLGQNKGMRALRLSAEADDAAPIAPATASPMPPLQAGGGRGNTSAGAPDSTASTSKAADGQKPKNQAGTGLLATG